MYTLIVMIAIAVMLIAGVLLVSYLLRKESKTRQLEMKQAEKSAVTTENSQWRAVKIAPGLISCSAAQKMAYTRFLTKDSPSLPLKACSQRECNCKYQYLGDRRSGGDRRIELGDLGKFLPVNQTERRQAVGRRTSDLAA